MMRSVLLSIAVSVWAAACTGEVSDDSGNDAGSVASDAGQGADAAPIVEADAGGQPDTGRQPDAGSHTLLASEVGCFLEVVDADSLYERVVGTAGAKYEWMSFDYDVIHGGWREDLYDREVLNHGLFGLSRNVPDFVGRYILGNAAQIRPGDPGLSRKSVFYGRVDLEPRPPGEGWMGYTSWRDAVAWQAGETYHVRVVLDAVAAQQVLEVTHGGDLVMRRVAPIDYFDPSLTSQPFTVTFGGVETDEREVKPLGWQFCDLEVHAQAL